MPFMGKCLVLMTTEYTRNRLRKEKRALERVARLARAEVIASWGNCWGTLRVK